MCYMMCLLVCHENPLSCTNLLVLKFDLGHDGIYFHQSIFNVTAFGVSLINVDLKIMTTNLWQSLSPVS